MVSYEAIGLVVSRDYTGGLVPKCNQLSTNIQRKYESFVQRAADQDSMSVLLEPEEFRTTMGWLIGAS
jgi:hypothetical protein